MEKSPRNFLPFRYIPHNNFESVGGKENSVTIRDSNLENKRTNTPSGVQYGKTPIQRQNNPYAKPTGDTCYHCNGRGHKSNICPTRKVYVVAEEREKKEEIVGHVVENDEYAGVGFVEEESDDRVNFVLQKILLASKDERQHKNLFKTHGLSRTSCVI